MDFLRHFNSPPVGSGYRKVKSASEDSLAVKSYFGPTVDFSARK
jgi:hypothetical protein